MGEGYLLPSLKYLKKARKIEEIDYLMENKRASREESSIYLLVAHNFHKTIKINIKTVLLVRRIIIENAPDRNAKPLSFHRKTSIKFLFLINGD